jgi:hypothetical protein
MAFIPVATELVLSAAEGGEAGNIVAGAETIATQFKNEVVKGGIFGAAEGALFGAGASLYHHIKKDLGLEKSEDGAPPPPPPPRKPRKRRIG